MDSSQDSWRVGRGTFQKKNISREELLSMMAGGEELDKLEVELEEMDRLNT